MKKQIIATLALMLLSSACSSSPENPALPGPTPSPSPSGPMMLKGTVSMILNFLAPSAYAMAPAHYGSIGSTVSLPYNTAEIGCQAARCAFLVDTGARDSTSKVGQQIVKPSSPNESQPISNNPGPPESYNKGNGKTLQSTPVVDGKYSFTFTADSPVLKAMAGISENDSDGRSYQGGIFKVIVRGWDMAANLPLDRGPDDREIALSIKDLNQVVKQQSEAQDLSIDLKTTLISHKKVEGIKADPNYTDDGSFLQNFNSLFFDGLHSVSLSSFFATLIPDDSNDDSNFIRASNIIGEFSSLDYLRPIATTSLTTKTLNDLTSNHKADTTFAADLQTEFTYIDSIIVLDETDGQAISSKFDKDKYLLLAAAYVAAEQTLDSLTQVDTSMMSDSDKVNHQLQMDAQTTIINNDQAEIFRGCAIKDELSALLSSTTFLQNAKARVNIDSLTNSGYLTLDQGTLLKASVNPSYAYPYTPVYNGLACCIALGNTYHQCRY